MVQVPGVPTPYLTDEVLETLRPPETWWEAAYNIVMALLGHRPTWVLLVLGALGALFILARYGVLRR